MRDRRGDSPGVVATTFWGRATGQSIGLVFAVSVGVSPRLAAHYGSSQATGSPLWAMFALGGSGAWAWPNTRFQLTAPPRDCVDNECHGGGAAAEPGR